MCFRKTSRSNQLGGRQIGIVIGALLALIIIIGVTARIIPLGSFSALVLPNHASDHLSTIGPLLAPLVSSVDHIVGMLTSIQIGLFAIVGFSLSQMSKESDAFLLVIVVALIFCLISFLSIYLGYAARMELLFQISSGSIDVENVNKNLWRQGIFLTIAALSAFLVVGLSYVSKK